MSNSAHELQCICLPIEHVTLGIYIFMYMYTCAYRSNNKKANKNLSFLLHVQHLYSIQDQELSIVGKENPRVRVISEKLS